jgi:hypothetical protein
MIMLVFVLGLSSIYERKYVTSFVFLNLVTSFKIMFYSSIDIPVNGNTEITDLFTKYSYVTMASSEVIFLKQELIFILNEF